MKIRKNALAGIALAATAALGLAACGGSPAPAGSASAEATNGEITVYNAQHESLTKEWADAFTAETGIKVTLRQGSDTEMSNQIVQEGAASPADVFLTENSPAMAQVENAGLFADVNKDTIAQVPAEFRIGGDRKHVLARHERARRLLVINDGSAEHRDDDVQRSVFVEIDQRDPTADRVRG